ncbi:MAG: glycerol-3-phosphate dehydrogenase/oxidase [Acidimicrobiia bacterium]|nr:MAG: glycerol-3-phosphate dehydrogenase/oxidase [Acidimicrobiia bacterium]
MTDLSLLGPAQRETALTRMADEPFDIAIIGGGSTGMGTALDAASRGLSVALIEQRDIASGTSSRSSKLIHGGLRYLERFEFKLVREALTERSLLLTKLAPHLVYPVPFIFPFRHRVWERAYVAAGVGVYDALAASSTNPLPRQRQLSRKSLLEAFPGLDRTAFVGGLHYYDAGTDDARFVLALARTAAREGAAIATSTRAVALPRQGDRVTGIAAVDLESGRELTIRADVVINATGVWTDAVERLVDDPVRDVTASKGVHLVVRKDRIDSSMGLITKTRKSVLFIIPFGEFWLIGTTDTAWHLDLAHPAASSNDIDYLIGQVNLLLADPLSRDDVVGVYAGLRPLVSGSPGATTQLSREHAITHPAPGMVTIAGGKFTTYRVMARDVVDEALGEREGTMPASRTEDVPLVGSDGWNRHWEDRAKTARDRDLPVSTVEHLLRRHGSDTERILDLIDADPDLGERLDPGAPALKVEVVWAAQCEAALHLDDLLTRRTRLSIGARDRGVAAAPEAARLVAPLLGWDETTIAREIEHYEARVTAEIESQTQPDDRTADAARLGAPDVRRMGL